MLRQKLDAHAQFLHDLDLPVDVIARELAATLGNCVFLGLKSEENHQSHLTHLLPVVRIAKSSRMEVLMKRDTQVRTFQQNLLPPNPHRIHRESTRNQGVPIVSCY